MPRTAGAGDKSQRTRRKQTEAERKQRNERKNAKKKEDQQKEKEDAERARPANTFFLPRSTIQQCSNDNDDNSNDIGDSVVLIFCQMMAKTTLVKKKIMMIDNPTKMMTMSTN